MHILIVHNSIIPAHKYGGTERVIWYLGKELTKQGHNVSYLVKEGSHCHFANIYIYNTNKLLSAQIPDSVDIVHFNGVEPDKNIKTPYIITQHGNIKSKQKLDKNSVFVSADHALRHSSEVFVYNGIDWDDYGKVSLNKTKKHFHYLAKAAWRVKNVTGAIETVTNTPNEKLVVLGGSRLNFKMGFRFTLSPRIYFKGMVGGEDKYQWMRSSKGLIFPVKWHEPFGLAITESLFFGCPIFGTPYGSLPELVNKDVGFLTNNRQNLTQAIINSEQFNQKICHELAVDVFNSKIMCDKYLKHYETVLNGITLNKFPPKMVKAGKDIGDGWC
ncbi:MAG: glycosyl transferase [Gammaproteobacteria bacterium]|nr:MAG: glycosyl transferase [Gammaproteobacteria bacterium]